MAYMLGGMVVISVGLLAVAIAQEFGLVWMVLFLIAAIVEWGYLWHRSSKRLGR